MTAALALLRRFWWAVQMLALGAALLAAPATLADRTATLRAERSAWTSALDDAEGTVGGRAPVRQQPRPGGDQLCCWARRARADHRSIHQHREGICAD
ncbi:hypothetical protein LK533_15030 [Sphingomonas sp. PL-96]|uniref:hypothetical protein n=1 Tax=Sphingomonas sp. PL-96 TaxID=2887201 RepID=UPI001E45AE03|nr:hypothetical protein [Sphingomonas sp. PL-96]MCC2977977.1 hypothetical protein [Sphingomonas sp. PL-96]